MALTVVSIASRCGYSRWDHLIDDAPLQDLIGQDFRDARAIRRAVEHIQRDTADPRVGLAPVAVEVRLANGECREIEA
jgi:outer membrane protein TolC